MEKVTDIHTLLLVDLTRLIRKESVENKDTELFMTYIRLSRSIIMQSDMLNINENASIK